MIEQMKQTLKLTPQCLGKVSIFSILIHQDSLIISKTTTLQFDQVAMFDARDDYNFIQKI